MGKGEENLKKKLSERDICTKFITPAIQHAGWDLHKQIREEVTFTAGRIIVKGKVHSRKKSKRADYILYYKPNIPIAIIEAKDGEHSVGDGMQQGLEYAEMLDIPFVFSSNGQAFLMHDRTGQSEKIEQEISLNKFPTPEELWSRYKTWKGIVTEEQEKIVTQDYFTDASGKTPRYYQRIAVNRAVEAIAQGKDRILLVLATGTGKTMIAFQLIWRLWKSKTKKRILFLADRNILVDQTMSNDFKHFGDKMTKIKNRTVDKSYEIFLALYQGVSGAEDWKNIYKEFSKDFFDLIIIDECHRGSAKEDSAWREILEYFSSATQVGLTATPKETKEVSNIDYFGEPLYTYSLKQGISDGFLAPYRVIRYILDKDTGWRPTKGQTDKFGEVIEDRIYNVKDFDRNLILEQRTLAVAKKVTEYLKRTDRYQKTIIFCTNINHAERMRQAIANENSDLVAKNHKYVMRITGDNDEGKAELDNFIHPGSTYPVIAVTSKLMTTGVDAQTCKLIVLDSNINSMTEFKQIIGRGTRVNEEHNKYSFTIMDFRNVTNLFADPDFDGDPVQIYEPKEGEPPTPPDEGEDKDDFPTGIDGGSGYDEDYDTEQSKAKTYYVHNVKVQVINERVQYYAENGQLITESLKDYTKNAVQKEYSSLDVFLQKWNSAERKDAIIEELIEQGILLDELQEEVGREYDPFDLICHVAFDRKPLTRTERAMNVKKQDYFAKYGDKARTVLEALLDKYADEGIENIESMEVLKLNPFDEFGSVLEIMKSFGGKKQYLIALQELQQQLYTTA